MWQNTAAAVCASLSAFPSASSSSGSDASSNHGNFADSRGSFVDSEAFGSQEDTYRRRKVESRRKFLSDSTFSESLTKNFLRVNQPVKCELAPDQKFHDLVNTPIKYRDVKLGSGRRVEPGKICCIHFEGKFLSGRKWESTWQHGIEYVSFVARIPRIMGQPPVEDWRTQLQIMYDRDDMILIGKNVKTIEEEMVERAEIRLTKYEAKYGKKYTKDAWESEEFAAMQDSDTKEASSIENGGVARQHVHSQIDSGKYNSHIDLKNPKIIQDILMDDNLDLDEDEARSDGRNKQIPIFMGMKPDRIRYWLGLDDDDKFKRWKQIGKAIQAPVLMLQNAETYNTPDSEDIGAYASIAEFQRDIERARGLESGDAGLSLKHGDSEKGQKSSYKAFYELQTGKTIDAEFIGESTNRDLSTMLEQERKEEKEAKLRSETSVFIPSHMSKDTFSSEEEKLEYYNPLISGDFPGLEQAVVGMREGGKREILIPPQMQRKSAKKTGEVMIYEVQVFRVTEPHVNVTMKKMEWGKEYRDGLPGYEKWLPEMS